MCKFNLPIKLTPAAKDYLWGGARLNDDFHLNMPVSPFAEAWVCSTHPDGPSLVAESGRPLAELLAEHPEYLGSRSLALTGGRPVLPVLVKLIDAAKDLSVQVHPGDEYAARVEGDLGKTELWYVLDAPEGTSLVYGFSRDVTADQVRAAAADGSIEQLLNHVPVHKGDVFFIKPGTVHAIGAGCLIAEIQQSSNICYRLYDYGRVDAHGNKRPLHLDKALDVADLKAAKSLKNQPTSCKYFRVENLLLDTEYGGRAEQGCCGQIGQGSCGQTGQGVLYRTGPESFHALLCVDGSGVLFGDGYKLPFSKGDCIFVPADSIELKLKGKAQILDVSC